MADAMREVLERLAVQNGVDPAASPDELMAQLAQDNPRLALLASLFARRRAEETRGADDVEEPPIAPDPPRAPDVRRLRRRLRRVAAEATQLREWNRALAGALGACDHCWGADMLCPRCRGAGEPGSYAPERPLFDRLVLPAVIRLRRQSVRPPTPASTAAHRATGPERTDNTATQRSAQ